MDEEFVNVVIIKIHGQTFCTVAFMLSWLQNTAGLVSRKLRKL